MAFGKFLLLLQVFISISWSYYYAGGTVCYNAATNCGTCASGWCSSCSSDSYCLESSQCKACSSKLNQCSTCSSCGSCLTCATNQYAISSSQCVACSSLMTGCSTCSSFNVCSTCVNSTYFLNSTLCAVCSTALSYCSQCSSQFVCTACIDNTFYVNSTTDKCLLCQSAMFSCLNCSSETVCTNCINNSYALNTTSKQCLPCSSFMNFCTNCMNNSICEACIVNPNIILYSKSCKYCSSVISNCLNCTKIDYCTVCSNYYFLSTFLSTSNCTLCASVMFRCLRCTSNNSCTLCGSGHLVINGCSNVPGCISVLNFPKHSCIACNSSEFYSQPKNGVCACLLGHLAGQYCTEIMGCTNILRTKSSDVCSACDRGNHFILKNGLCVCQVNYVLNGQTCIDICGDGKVLTVPCDDGNLDNGDGCSSTCQIQKGYICKTNTTAAINSFCIFKGWIQLKLVCAYKLEDNQAEIILSFNPFTPNLLKSDFTNRITFSSNKSCSMANFQIIGSNLHIYVSYRQDIEGSTAEVNVEYDPNYILSPLAPINFTINECNKDALIYDPYSSGKSLKSTILVLVKVLGILAVLFWLFGSYSHKMIGVQTLHTFHLIFVTQAFTSHYSPVVICFSQLSSTMSLFQDYFYTKTNIGYEPYNRLDYSADFVYNDSAIFILQTLVLAIFGVLYFYDKFYSQPQNGTLTKQQTQNASKYKQKWYNFLVFPFFIGFLLNLVISLMVQSTPNYSKSASVIMQALIVLLAVIPTSLIFTFEWKHLLVRPKSEIKDEGCEMKYVPLYLTNFFIQSLVVQASIFGLIASPLYVMAALAVGYTVFLIVYRPYSDWVHNLGIIVNQAGLILNLGWLLLQEFMVIRRSYQQIIALVLIAWMFLILGLATIRIILQLKKKNFCPAKRQKIHKPKLAIQNGQSYNKKILHNLLKQTSFNLNSYRLSAQLIREKQCQQIRQQQSRQLKRQLLKNQMKFRQP